MKHGIKGYHRSLMVTNDRILNGRGTYTGSMYRLVHIERVSPWIGCTVVPLIDCFCHLATVKGFAAIVPFNYGLNYLSRSPAFLSLYIRCTCSDVVHERGSSERRVTSRTLKPYSLWIAAVHALSSRVIRVVTNVSIQGEWNIRGSRVSFRNARIALIS